MIPTLRKTSQGLEFLQIPYILGDESLVGLVEGNLERYRYNPILYLLPQPLRWLKLLLLACYLLPAGILVKPKYRDGALQFKIRRKTGLRGKAENFVFALPLRRRGKELSFQERGRRIDLPQSRVGVDTLVLNQDTGIPLRVPSDAANFVEEFREVLFSKSYQKPEVVFDEHTAFAAEEMLSDVADILNGGNYHWWLEGGTLLGIYRDGKLLDWDHDVDTGVRFESEARTQELIRELKKTGYYLKVLDFPLREGVWRLGEVRLIKIYPRKWLVTRDELCLDLFIFYREPHPDTGQDVYKYVVRQRNGYHPAAMLDEIQYIPFRQMQVSIPVNAEQFLESKYGPNWRTPVKDWNVALDDGTISNNRDTS